MSCMLPEYAVGIRSFRPPSPADIATQPHCYKNAIHGGRVGEWEVRAIAPDAPIPPGWRVTGHIPACAMYGVSTMTLITYIYWERIIP